MWMYPESVFVYFETWLWACWHIQSVPCHPGNYHPLGKVPTLPINTAFLTLIAYVGVPFINTSGAYAHLEWRPSTSYTASSATPMEMPGTPVVAWHLHGYTWTSPSLAPQMTDLRDKQQWDNSTVEGEVEKLLAWVKEWRIPTLPFSQTHYSCLWP